MPEQDQERERLILIAKAKQKQMRMRQQIPVVAQPQQNTTAFGEVQTNPQMSDNAGGMAVPRPRAIANPLLQQPTGSQVRNFGDILQGAASVATMPVTGWASIPAFMASSGIGSVLNNAVRNMGGVQSKSVGDIAKEAGGQALVGGALAAVPMIPGALKRGFAKNVMPTTLPERLYQSALKPPIGEEQSNIAKMVGRGLSEQRPITEKSLVDLHQTIQNAQTATDAIINTGSTAGDALDVQKFFRAKDVVDQIFAKRGMPEKNAKAIQKWFDQELDQLAKDYPSGFMPTSKAQELKKSLNTELQAAYGELKSSQKESGKQFARAIKEDLEAVYPELKNLNATAGERIELEKAIARRLNIEINGMQTIPMQPSAFGGAGAAAIAGLKAPTAAFTLLYEFKRALDLPGIKSKLAIALHAARKAGSGPVPSGMIGRTLRTGAIGGATQSVQDTTK